MFQAVEVTKQKICFTPICSEEASLQPINQNPGYSRADNSRAKDLQDIRNNEANVRSNDPSGIGKVTARNQPVSFHAREACSITSRGVTQDMVRYEELEGCKCPIALIMEKHRDLWVACREAMPLCKPPNIRRPAYLCVMKAASFTAVLTCKLAPGVTEESDFWRASIRIASVRVRATEAQAAAGIVAASWQMAAAAARFLDSKLN